MPARWIACNRRRRCTCIVRALRQGTNHASRFTPGEDVMVGRRCRNNGRSRTSTIARMLMIAGFLASAAGASRYCNAATPEQVQSAIENAKEFLYKQQNPRGTWERVEQP